MRPGSKHRIGHTHKNSRIVSYALAAMKYRGEEMDEWILMNVPTDIQRAVIDRIESVRSSSNVKASG